MANPILFNDFKAEYRELHDQLHAAIDRVLASGYFLLGTETQAFESELATALGRQHVVAVGNGTEALAIALIASGVQPGDEVIVPALTAYPTIIAVEMAQAIPVVCEVEAHTGLLDPKKIPDLITKKTKAIVPVHLYGQLCDMTKIAKIAKAHDVLIIEDTAQAIFATHRGQPAGSWSSAMALSFYPSKNLGAYGDAGAVVTDDEDIYQKALRLRQYGQSNRYLHDEFGFNSRIDEIQAAILRVKLPHVKRWIKKRQKIADYYLANLTATQPLKAGKDNNHTFHLFVTRVKDQSRFLAHTADHHIPTIIHYPKTIYQQPAFSHHIPLLCPRAEKLVTQIVSLPVHPYLKTSQLAKICKVVNQFQD